MTLDEWLEWQWEEDFNAGMRLGQSYMNRVRPDDANSALFHETDSAKAWTMIEALEEKPHE